MRRAPGHLTGIFILRFIIVAAIWLGLSGCATMTSQYDYIEIDRRNLPPPDLVLAIPGLSVCNRATDSRIALSSDQPVTVLVHGCRGSAARFRALAQVFAFHGQQSVCFSYDDRDSLMKSSGQLINALSRLSEAMGHNEITVIGHSQGGLISRKALIQERDIRLLAHDKLLRLVTISTPFAGIAAAEPCVSPTQKILTLGLLKPICWLISGDKWYEITRPSPFIQEPGRLVDAVTTHLKVVTDEVGACRRYRQDGTCRKDDFVFSVAEQYFAQVDGDQRVENLEVAAGHAEIVGDYLVPPGKLIAILQAQQVMNETPPARQADLSVLLAQLYGQ